MLRRLSPALLCLSVLLCAVRFTAAGSAFGVNESATRVRLSREHTRVSLALNNPTNHGFNARVLLELLDTKGHVLSAVEGDEKIKTGSSVLDLPLPVSILSGRERQQLPWYRLRYRITPAPDSGTAAETQGIISLSEIVPDIFELHVTGPAYSYEGMRYRARVQAVHPISQRPAKGVRVEGEISLNNDGEAEDDRIHASATTDADGYAALDFDLPRGTDADDARIKVTGRLGDFEQEAEDSVSLQHLAEILITTDKPIYQPGQTLHVRALIRDPLARRALADTEAKVEISDPESTDVFRTTLRTSRFGVASADWPIAENTRLGDYRIEIKIEDGRYEDSYSSQTVRISRYELPNFVVKAKPDRGYYLPGENSEVVVSADYVFGQPVKRGHVRVVREAEREWNYAAQKWDVEEKETFEGETDDEGRFVARINLAEAHRELAGESDSKRFQDLSYAAYFTDPTTNRTEQRRFDVRVTREAIHVYLIGTQDSGQARDLPLQFYLSTFYADGSPASCAVTIDEETAAGEIAVAARARTLPKLPPNRRTLRTIHTNELGLAKVDELLLPPGDERGEDVSLRFTARDEQGRTGHESDDLDLSDGTVIRIETEKTIHRAGEPIKVQIVANRPSLVVNLDVMQRARVFHSQAVRLRDGKASIRIPFRKEFKDELTIIAQALPTPGDDDELNRGARTVIYPRERELQFDVRFDKPEYRPGEEASALIHVRDAEGRAVEGALGVVVTDRAVDERARTDREFGQRGGYYEYILSALGYGVQLTGVSRRDLDHLDRSKSIPPGFDLAAEIMLNRSSNESLETFGEGFTRNQKTVFSSIYEPQLKPLKDALAARYAKLEEYPRDEAALRRALSEAGVNLDALRDPWGMPYRVRFASEQESDVLEIISAAADKRSETVDDFVVARLAWPYFRPIGEAVERALKNYHARTGGFISDRATLQSELMRENIDFDALRDRWGSPFGVRFDTLRREFIVGVSSAGPNKRFDTDADRKHDDFQIWTARLDYFAPVEQRLNAALEKYVETRGSFPKNEAEFREAARLGGVEEAELRDPSGRPFALTFEERPWLGTGGVAIRSYARYGETPQRRVESSADKQKLHLVILRSLGKDGADGNDDYYIASFARVLEEKTPDAVAPKPASRVASTNPGMLSGLLLDPSGAAIAGATVKVKNKASGIIYETVTNDEGMFAFAHLQAGMYEIMFESRGFQGLTITEVPVQLAKVTDVRATLEVGAATETVMVTAGEEMIQTTSSSMSSIEYLPILPRSRSFMLLEPGVSKSGGQMSTPRLREYFPETLVWQPSIETDGEGRAQLKFKLADNITTWKVALIGSTLEGDIGLAVKELRAFQPFFIEHDPPRVLTEGDEISLPVVARNYLDKPQAVELEMKPEEWFTPLGPTHKRAQVEAGDTARETFDFRAVSTVKEGKQRVNALAQEESDAVEKPVSVHPNGEEIMQTNGAVFGEAGTLDVNFPSGTITGTARAELKIYPNLLAHVFEGVEGIMRRPYGCGEQTISSTYPSLLVLRHYRQRGASVDAQQQQLPPVARRAEAYVRAGYERLLGYRTQGGGFSYWGGDSEADRALTAYAIKFLRDARDVTTVDEGAVAMARDWLVSQQRDDGAWPVLTWDKSPDTAATLMLTGYVARILASEAKPAGRSGAASPPPAADAKASAALKRALEYLARHVEKSGDPYMLANYALAARARGDVNGVRLAARRLSSLKKEEAGQSYWEPTTGTPFHGWGLGGRIETTALVVRALSPPATEDSAHVDADRSAAAEQDALKRSGLLYLLRHKDTYGVWYSTQATVNVLDTLSALSSKTPPATAQPATIPATAATNATDAADILVNNRRVATLSLPAADQLSGPVALDLSPFIVSPGDNRVEIRRRAAASEAMAQIVSTHYKPWPDSSAEGGGLAAEGSSSKSLRLQVGFDRTEAEAAQSITCSVEVSRGRVAGGGGGMLLAEIGLPPGVEVDRASLQEALQDSSAYLDRYDVLPDRLVVYLWPYSNRNARFNFKFTPRYGLRALSAPSLVYDYYNPEARAVVAPTKFVIR